MVTCLLQTAQRQDNTLHDNRLQISAFEAINDMVGGQLLHDPHRQV
jgi:hypothetical protein